MSPVKHMKFPTLLAHAFLALSLTVACGGGGSSSDNLSASFSQTFTPTNTAAGDVVVGDVIQFTNTSTQVDTYLWDFGDGTTSTLADPAKTYATAVGAVTITLTATDTVGNTDTATLDVNVVPAPVAEHQSRTGS